MSAVSNKKNAKNYEEYQKQNADWTFQLIYYGQLMQEEIGWRYYT